MNCEVERYLKARELSEREASSRISLARIRFSHQSGFNVNNSHNNLSKKLEVERHADMILGKNFKLFYRYNILGNEMPQVVGFMLLGLNEMPLSTGCISLGPRPFINASNPPHVRRSKYSFLRSK